MTRDVVRRIGEDTYKVPRADSEIESILMLCLEILDHDRHNAIHRLTHEISELSFPKDFVRKSLPFV